MVVVPEKVARFCARINDVSCVIPLFWLNTPVAPELPPEDVTLPRIVVALVSRPPFTVTTPVPTAAGEVVEELLPTLRVRASIVPLERMILPKPLPAADEVVD